MTATVEGLNLTKVYHLGAERLYVLNDVSLEVHPGELVAILGRPGTGKSTLLHILGCLQRPDSGRVRIEDQDVPELDDHELAQFRNSKVGFVFQAFNLLPNETAFGNVAVALRRQSLDAWTIRQKAEAALNAVGLGNRLEHRPGQISARQRQCVAIARALVHDPVVILADEPTRALDSTSREEVMGLLQKLNGEGKTMVIATTDSGVARYCHRIVKIADGKIEDEGQVSRRRVLPLSGVTGPPPATYEREVTVCSRCNYGNFSDQELCQSCEFPLQLTEEEEQSIEGRLSGTERRWLGVESTSDEGDVPGQDMVVELKEVPFFAGLGSKSLVKILPGLEQRRFQKGSEIVKQGDDGDAFYIIRSGRVQVLVEREGGHAIHIAELGPHEGFGEMALLSGQPRSATVVTLTDVDTWLLAKPAFDELLSENLSLASYFNRILSQRLRTLQERIVP